MLILILHRLRKRIACPRPLSFAGRTLAGVLVLAFGSLPAQADESQGVLDQWGAHTFGVESCAGMLELPDSEISTATGCVADQVFVGLLGIAVQFADEHGKALFGEHFRLDHRLGFSTSGGGLGGDLDAVIPLNSFTSVSDDRVTRALFLQNGLSRWRDEHGFQRNDMRFGMVHRIAVSEQPGTGMFGTSVFFQENLERGHARIVPGLDYTHRWGRGSLSYFMPVTDWRLGRLGYEERALEGVEFELRSDVTRTVEFKTAAGQWESKDGSGDWNTRGRFGVQWQPHPWFGIRGDWADIGTEDDSLGLHAVVSVPFGGSDEQARWQGLGLTSLGSDGSDPETIWNSVDNVGQIEVAERDASPPDPDDGSGVSGTLLGEELWGQLPTSQ